MALMTCGEHLKASGDPLSLVVHERQYVLARVDVQRLLVKSVRFAKVSVVEMPINRGIPLAVDRFEHRASTAAIELLRDQHAAIHVRIQQGQRTPRCSLAPRNPRAAMAVAGTRRARGGSRTLRPVAARTSCCDAFHPGIRTRCPRESGRTLRDSRAGCEGSASRSGCRSASRCARSHNLPPRENHRWHRPRPGAARARAARTRRSRAAR